MRAFFRYLRYRKSGIILFVVCACLMTGSLYLYRLPVRAAAYPLCLCALAGLVTLAVGYRQSLRRHRILEKLAKDIDNSIALPEAESLHEEDYQRLLTLLKEKNALLLSESSLKYNDMVDYYTVWAHQIKTPIAAIRLTLQNEDSDLSRRLQSDLGRIERYVEMVLTFLRLDSPSTDLVIRRTSLDALLRSCVRSFSSEFILKGLKLDYKATDSMVLTDEKWLAFVIEQVLSNAVKYTDKGTISIGFEENGTLYISDTGIGISARDLPRVFENGYTGFNGRSHKKATGIGLYLCKRICDKLGHGISITSTEGAGTRVEITFGTDEIDIE